jgi:hypothetical protein
MLFPSFGPEKYCSWLEMFMLDFNTFTGNNCKLTQHALWVIQICSQEHRMKDFSYLCKETLKY